jgi:hypothetical protein
MQDILELYKGETGCTLLVVSFIPSPYFLAEMVLQQDKYTLRITSAAYCAR